MTIMLIMVAGVVTGVCIGHILWHQPENNESDEE